MADVVQQPMEGWEALDNAELSRQYNNAAEAVAGAKQSCRSFYNHLMQYGEFGQRLARQAASILDGTNRRYTMDNIRFKPDEARSGGYANPPGPDGRAHLQVTLIGNRASDASIMAHEIAHTFDRPDNPRQDNPTRNLLAETTAECFEMMAHHYLAEQGQAEPGDIGILRREQPLMNRRRALSSLLRLDALDVLDAKTVTSDTMNAADTTIDAADLQTLMSQHPEQVADYLKSGTRIRPGQDFRYGIAGYIVPQFEQMYINSPDQAMRAMAQWCQAIKRNDLPAALASFHILTPEQTRQQEQLWRTKQRAVGGLAALYSRASIKVV